SRRSSSGTTPVDSLRMSLCARPECGALFHLCAGCDRGQWYCSSACSAARRVASLRAARKRHQSSPEGRDDHRDRQRAYRARRRLQLGVTEHGAENLPSSSTVLVTADAPDITSEPEIAETERTDELVHGRESRPRGDANPGDGSR